MKDKEKDLREYMISLPKHVNIREKKVNSGVWWVFVSYEGKRTSRRIGPKTKAKEVAKRIRQGLFEPRRRKSNRSFLERMNNNIGKRIGQAIKKKKPEVGWEKQVGYSLKELKEHLEKQFKPGMTWWNYGRWHIDHIVPIVAFDSTYLGDSYLKKCWALSNLQPLWAFENLSKGKKIPASFCTLGAPWPVFGQKKRVNCVS